MCGSTSGSNSALLLFFVEKDTLTNGGGLGSKLGVPRFAHLMGPHWWQRGRLPTSMDQVKNGEVFNPIGTVNLSLPLQKTLLQVLTPPNQIRHSDNETCVPSSIEMTPLTDLPFEGTNLTIKSPKYPEENVPVSLRSGFSGAPLST